MNICIFLLTYIFISGSTHAMESANKTILINSLNDASSPVNLKLQQEKGHRLLDTLARMIAYKLIIDNSFPGSLSLVFSGDALLISTKRDISRDMITYALEQVLNKLLASCKNSSKNCVQAEKKKIEKLKKALKRVPNENGMEFNQKNNARHQARNALDEIKFKRALSVGYNDKLSRHIFNFFKSKNYADNIVVIENPEGFHSEIQLITYVKKNNLYWDKLKNSDNSPYQYIGGSMLSCGVCNSVIKGETGVVGINQKIDTTNIIFFVRGTYHMRKETYNLPQWTLALNENFDEHSLRNMLWKIIQSEKGISKAHLLEIKEAQLSESEEE